MANPKIPDGYQGTFINSADGSPVLVMVSKTESIADSKTTKKEQKPMDEQQQAQKYVPYSTEQKKEYAKQFTPEQIKSYRNGQRSAYAHMGNIGKRNSFFIYDNLKKNETAAAAPPSAKSAKPPKKGK